MSLDLAAVTEIPVLLGLILLVAFLGKLLGAGIPAYLSGVPLRASSAIGAGMCARGAVELIVAGIALRAGLFDSPEPPPPEVSFLFSAVVIMAVVTTIAAPMIMAPLMRDTEKSEEE